MIGAGDPSDPADAARSAAPEPGELADAAGAPEPGTPAPTYEHAEARIEEIIRRLDSGEAGLRETLDLVREGRALVDFCATELDAVSRGLAELRLDDLVQRLERGPDPGPGAA